MSELDNVTDDQIKEARNLLWEAGCLEWKLTITQKKLYDFFHSRSDKTIVINAARRLGKSYALVVMAIEKCLQKPNSVVKFLQPQVNMIRTNIRPIFDEILTDCPFQLAPEYSTQDNIYKFPNGSQIQLAGTDNGNYMKLRGGNSDLAIIDEAGFCTDLSHIINYILIPTTTLTKGRIILSSTTPPHPDHEFIKYMERAEVENRLIRKTIYDAVDDDTQSDTPRLTEVVVADIIKSIPNGVNSDSFRTEYLCEIITNSKDSIIPEFTNEIRSKTIKETSKPIFCDKYVSMDVGVMDLTAILFAFYDFDNAVLVIQDEIVLEGDEVGAKNISRLVKEKEAELWTNKLTREVEPVYKRISDNNLILLNDLSRDYGVTFLATDKHNKEAYINKLRTMVSEQRIIINPKCINLIAHLKNGTWDKNRKEFKRSGELYGHYDFVDALAYLVRNLDEFKNPYPRGYAHQKLSEKGPYFVAYSKEEKENNKYNQIADMFKPKSKYNTFDKAATMLKDSNGRKKPTKF